MTSQQFLLLSFMFAAIFGVWYWISLRKQQAKPSMLDMSKPTTQVVASAAAPLGQKLQEQIKAHPPKYSSTKVETLKIDHELTPTPIEKNLNVFFNYNGHTWDAYEVLGVPAGAPLNIVTQYYQRALAGSDKESHPFLQTAYQAILAKY